jgi:hypothetical protein
VQDINAVLSSLSGSIPQAKRAAFAILNGNAMEIGAEWDGAAKRFVAKEPA